MDPKDRTLTSAKCSGLRANLDDLDKAEGRCSRECRTTWHEEHGGAVPGGPFPGTRGAIGDVRRCEHGRLWFYVGTYENVYYCLMDRWRRIYPVFEPRRYRRAQRALAASS